MYKEGNILSKFSVL